MDRALAALDQPQLAEAAGDGGAREGKAAATVLPAPLHPALQGPACQEAWDLQGAVRSEAERQWDREAGGQPTSP